MGILSGDVGFFLAMGLALRSGIPAKAKLLALQQLFDGLVDTACGEVLDVQLSVNSDPTEDDIFRATKFKTANYTVIAPMRIGALAAQGVRDMETVINQFGLPLGIAYQIRDDYLGMFSSEEEMGKSSTSDLAEGKKTYLWYWATKKATGMQRQRINVLHSKRKVSIGDLEEVRDVFRELGVDKKARVAIKLRIEQAIASIPSLTVDRYLQVVLRGLCEKMIVAE